MFRINFKKISYIVFLSFFSYMNSGWAPAGYTSEYFRKNYNPKCNCMHCADYRKEKDANDKNKKKAFYLTAILKIKK